jgi:quinoprotein glucose dehydrogenase
VAEEDLWAVTPEHFEACQAKLQGLRNEGIYTPPSLQGSILIPGNSGGANWAGGAVDPESGLLYVPVNDVPMTIQLEALPKNNVNDTDGVVLRFGWSALRWVLTGKGTGLRYDMRNRARFVHDGRMCTKPPWGTLAAIDVADGSVRWQVPLGENETGVRGLPNAGPPLVTAGGLVFQGGTADQHLWVFDATTGDIMTSFALPAALHAGPITYKTHPEGKQYLVVAPGGHVGLDTELGDYVIGYALP